MSKLENELMPSYLATKIYEQESSIRLKLSNKIEELKDRHLENTEQLLAKIKVLKSKIQSSDMRVSQFSATEENVEYYLDSVVSKTMGLYDNE